MKKTLLALTFCVALTGCYVQSLYKFYTDDLKVALPQIAGEWLSTLQVGDDVSDKKVTPWSFTADRITTYDKESKSSELEVVYFKIGEALFMDFTAGEPAKDCGNAFWFAGVTPVHSLCKVILDDKSLVIIPLNFEWFEEQVKQKKMTLALVKADSHSNTIYTALPEQWVAFLKTHANDKEVFSEKYKSVFVRPPKKPDLRPPLQKILTKMEAVTLGPWDQEQSVTVTEKDALSYKTVDAAGTVRFVDKLPAGPEGIAKLYVRQSPVGFAMVITNKGQQFVWIRLYWEPKTRLWSQMHPQLEAFHQDQRYAEDFIRTLAERYDINAGFRIPVLLAQMKAPPTAATPEADPKLQTELQALSAKVGGSWGGAELLAQALALDVQIAKAADADKLKLAAERRKLLKTLLQRLPP